jgi:DNA-binding CsgD family transcriptional regulator
MPYAEPVAEELRIELDALLPAERTIIETIVLSARNREPAPIARIPEVHLSEGARRVLSRPPYWLTQREMQVLTHLFDSRTNKQVAVILGISPRTVEIHRAQILKKLRVKDMVALVKFVMTVMAATEQAN